MTEKTIGVWFPAIRTHSGTDIFTERLVSALRKRNIRAEISWLPHRAEYAPWSVKPSKMPPWANIVHINTWLPRKFIPNNIPVIATSHLCVHDQALLKYKSHTQRFYHEYWIKYVEKHAINRANLVSAVSDYTARVTGNVFSISNVYHTPNWIDAELFQPDSKKKPNRPFQFLYLGNLSRRKGSDFLVLLMAELGDGFELRFTGHRSELAKFGDLSDNIIGIGHLSSTAEVQNALNNCDALIFPTRLEGFGLAALEAQACGRPVLSTLSSSIPEVVKNGKTGILCEPDNLPEFAAAARKLLDDQNLWSEMSSHARQFAIENFREDVCVQRYIDLYSKLAGVS